MYTVVIVDDEIRIANGLARMIQNYQIDKLQTQVFYDSEEAAAWVRNHKKSVNVLITDICMPKVSGLELIAECRKQISCLPCLILTGYEEFEYAKKAISLGVVNYCLKPVDPKELRESIESILFEKSIKTEDGEPHILSAPVLTLKNEIDMNYRDFNMDEIADRLYLRKDYLGRLFKKETGSNVVDYLTEVRLERSKELLEEVGRYKVYEVSYMVGYDDHAYFSRLFKQKYGITPKEYQKYRKSHPET